MPRRSNFENFRIDIRNLRRKLIQNPLLKLIIVQTREPVKLMSQRSGQYKIAFFSALSTKQLG